MPTEYDPILKATVFHDDASRLRSVTHLDEYPEMAGVTAAQAAHDYLAAMIGAFDLAATNTGNATQPLSYFDPEPRDLEFRLRDQKSQFDTATVVFNQTFLNLPVWEAGVTVTLKQAPWRAVASTNTTEQGVDAPMPSEQTIARWLALFDTAEKSDVPPRLKLARSRAAASEAAAKATRAKAKPLDIGELLGSTGDAGNATSDGGARQAKLIRGRFYVYRYDAKARLETHEHQGKRASSDDQPLCGTPPPFPFPIPPVPDKIRDGQWTVAAELIIRLPTEGARMNWRLLVEVETGAILYLRALSSGVNGLVFTYDPITSTGVAGNTPNQNNATLNPLRDDVTLPNLNAPVGGVQSLSGSRATIADFSIPTVAAPTRPSGSDFDYDVRTNDFAAVNAYYHTDRFFQMVEGLGFALGTFFDGTAFPVEVDHRGKGTAANQGNIINADCIGDGDGIDYTRYALADTADTGNPIGIATDWRVVLHELGGHGILYDHVGTANFGQFTNANGVTTNRVHSFGDSFAMIMNDFSSAWHGGAAIDRFVLAPFVPVIVRRSDRTVASGWGWGGANDLGNYDSEQVLSTTMFRFYRSIGGDSTSLSRREFSARVSCYLMLRAVSTLSPVSNPNTPQGILAALDAADDGDWTSEGLAGGAYGKVLAWSFEAQNLNSGARPAVDVYIDDGRGGEYPYQPVHWANGSVWNRRSADGLAAHQEPELGATNYAYVRLRNRGTTTATNVTVKGYHCRPSAGVLWPNDLQPMTTAQLSAANIAPNDSATITVGPFEWTPTLNAWGHDCMLMIVSASGDPSNVDNLSPGEVYADWRLVPNDNNVGQRNVNPVAAGGGIAGILASLHGKGFWIGNPGRRRAVLQAKIDLPSVLVKAGWRIRLPDLPDKGFVAKGGTSRLLTFEVEAGQPVTPEAVRGADSRDIVVTATADGAIIGGMVYRLDPDLAFPHNERLGGGRGIECRDKAQALLECLDVGDAKVKCVRIRKVAVDIEMDDDGCCN